MLEFVVVTEGCYARVTEIVDLRAEHVQLEPEEGVWLHNKGFRLRTLDTQTPLVFRPRSSITDEAWAILSRRKVEREGHDLVFPPKEWKLYRLRAAMKAAAVELGWPRDLDLDSPHALRHGGITRLVAQGMGGEVQASVGTVIRYGRPNEVRRRGGSEERECVARIVAQCGGSNL